MPKCPTSRPDPRRRRRIGIATLLATVLATAAIGTAPPAARGEHETAGQPGARGIGRAIAFSQAPGGVVRWIMPGPRRLDPSLFGTPQNPQRTDPNTGVALDDRLTTADGSRFTTTLAPTPFSDSFAPVGGGFEAVLIDRTANDTEASQDEALFRAVFTGPNGVHQYRIELTRLLPIGHHHPFFGGVLIDGRLHGATGIGTALQPTLHAIGAFWGIARLFINEQLIADNRMIHFMATQRVRSPDFDGYRLLWDNELGRARGLHVHVLLPDHIVTPSGIETSPVPSGLITPTGMRQTFIHLMFENPTLTEITAGTRAGPR